MLSKIFSKASNKPPTQSTNSINNTKRTTGIAYSNYAMSDSDKEFFIKYNEKARKEGRTLKEPKPINPEFY